MEVYIYKICKGLDVAPARYCALAWGIKLVLQLAEERYIEENYQPDDDNYEHDEKSRKLQFYPHLIRLQNAAFIGFRAKFELYGIMCCKRESFLYY